MDGLRIGTVSYANARPLTWGLSGLVSDVPSRLADRFRGGEFDVAILPAFEALRMPDRPIVPGLAIASEGPVDSVVLFHRRPLPEVARVRLDAASRTSAALTRVLFAEAGIPAVFGPAGGRPDPAEDEAVLVIGDPALRARREGLLVTDLATEWRVRTGLPFVFAVWVARDAATAARAQGVLEAARERGRREIRDVAREAARTAEYPEGAMLAYLTERVTYDLGARERAGLAAFGGLCRRHRLL